MIAPGAIAVGVLFAVGLYLLLARNTQRVAMGFMALSNGVNLLVIVAGGLTPGARPPITDRAAEDVFADPLPQAFVLTAIVIGLGTTAILCGMAVRASAETGHDELPPGGGP